MHGDVCDFECKVGLALRPCLSMGALEILCTEFHIKGTVLCMLYHNENM